MKNYDFGKRLKYFREQAGMTQAELAEKLNKSTHHITQIERGISLPSLPIFFDICLILQVPADCFAMDENKLFAQYAAVGLADKLNNLNHQDLITAAEILQSIFFALNHDFKSKKAAAPQETSGGESSAGSTK